MLKILKNLFKLLKKVDYSKIYKEGLNLQIEKTKDEYGLVQSVNIKSIVDNVVIYCLYFITILILNIFIVSILLLFGTPDIILYQLSVGVFIIFLNTYYGLIILYKLSNELDLFLALVGDDR